MRPLFSYQVFDAGKLCFRCVGISDQLMFKSYTDIYDRRGAVYHEAMQRWPLARAHEFETLVVTASIEVNEPVILDIPSGGGYLSEYLPKGARLISVDSAANFLNSGTHPGVAQKICAPHSKVPLADGVSDAILSLAGLHHIDDQQAVFREWFRLLKTGGVVAIGDAKQGSATAEFLDGVVGRFNSMGHVGNYLGAAQVAMLEAEGFNVTLAEEKGYPWIFTDRQQMLGFCRTLFCMDKKPADDELLAEIKRTVGFQESDTHCELNWGLFFVRAIKV